jgi:hypothetical protein
MEEQKDNKDSKMCNCGWCTHAHGGWHGHHIVFRLLVVLIAIMVAFWLGLKLGELRTASFNAGY